MRHGLKAALLGTLAAGFFAGAGHAQSQSASSPGYQGAPRTELFNPALTSCIRDTGKYKKAPPYTIGFSNAGLGDSWRVVALDELKQGAEDHKDVIKKLIITDAGHDDAKQVSDVQDLASQGVDLMIVSANTEKALDPVVTRVMRQGIPVIMLDRRISSDHFVTYINASDPMMGRLWAQWIVEKLHGKGNVVLLGGQAGSSPNENRMGPAKEIFAQYPGIHILDTVYSDWSPVKGKQVMQAVIAKYGHKIDAVWSAHGLQVPGSIEAFVEAGFKPGEIPMHTTADVNGPLLMALKYKVPMLEISDPPAQYRTAIDVALKVLSGAAVPCTYTVNSQISVTAGDETPSIKSDEPFASLALPDKPSNYLVTNDLGHSYDPTTAHTQYPH
ncbi:ABC transporter substrate-binding protein [Acidisoma silvae]|uniref:ABC transporter substrate-binding protein n=1 Tax=Acidisoma silvae TaxID=2802396 RepID=A0A963YU76_9PROT|nr:ABC transporter substrate-binding protein [Acidisoma silvae]MCB8877150.1 ABC transporter substrate-binding protein [Acidisoma silvae]